MSFHKVIEISNLNFNFVDLISNKWFLITCGTNEKYNTMTASWGGVGHLWNKEVVFTFIRPQRCTYEFVEKNELFSICFFDERYKDIL